VYGHHVVSDLTRGLDRRALAEPRLAAELVRVQQKVSAVVGDDEPAAGLDRRREPPDDRQVLRLLRGRRLRREGERERHGREVKC
jgi:hypothetical protein